MHSRLARLKMAALPSCTLLGPPRRHLVLCRQEDQPARPPARLSGRHAATCQFPTQALLAPGHRPAVVRLEGRLEQEGQVPEQRLVGPHPSVGSIPTTRPPNRRRRPRGLLGEPLQSVDDKHLPVKQEDCWAVLVPHKLLEAAEADLDYG